MRSVKFLHIFTLAVFAVFLFSCKKDTQINVIPAKPFATAGTNQKDLEQFQVTLNADSLKSGQIGRWTIEKGLLEKDFVYFSNEDKPDSKFNGMPGETYILKWKVTGTNPSESTVTISFKAMKVEIKNSSPLNKTKFFLEGTMYRGGVWKIEGKYATLVNKIAGGTVTESINSPSVMFQGYANNKYKLVWTSFYGSKSASATIEINTGDYLESEAIYDLQLSSDSYRLGYENGHITKLNLASSGIAWILSDTVQFPALQALKHLKELDLSGSSTSKFPSIIGDRFLKLESLNIESTYLTSIPENIGNLTKLRRLLLGHFQYGARLVSLPEGFGKLESLEYFIATASGLRYLPFSFSKLKKLKHFECYLNPLSELPWDIGELTNLEVMWVSSASTLPASISKLTKLRRLYYVSSASNDVLPDDFGNLENLDSLTLQSNFVSIPNSFTNLKISYLDLPGTTINTLPENIGNLTNLTSITLGGKFKSLPASFCNLKNLAYVHIGSPEIEKLPERIGDLKKLAYFTMQNGKLKTLPNSIGDLPELIEIKLDMNEIESLPSNFFNLPKLGAAYLSYNRITSISDDFSKLANTLWKLNINGNNFSLADGIKIKQLLPKTTVFTGF